PPWRLAEGATMTKRGLLAAVAGVALLALVIAIFFLSRPRSSITFDSYQQIQSGMTRLQVESILGGPARQEVRPTVDVRSGVWLSEEWWGEEGVIFVRFDEADKVSEKHFSLHWCNLSRPGVAERLRSWRP